MYMAAFHCMSDRIEILSCLKTRQDYDFNPIENSEMQPWPLIAHVTERNARKWGRSDIFYNFLSSNLVAWIFLAKFTSYRAVSYTHLTLPTICSV